MHGDKMYGRMELTMLLNVHADLELQWNSHCLMGALGKSVRPLTI